MLASHAFLLDRVSCDSAPVSEGLGKEGQAGNTVDPDQLHAKWRGIEVRPHDAKYQGSNP